MTSVSRAETILGGKLEKWEGAQVYQVGNSCILYFAFGNFHSYIFRWPIVLASSIYLCTDGPNKGKRLPEKTSETKRVLTCTLKCPFRCFDEEYKSRVSLGRARSPCILVIFRWQDIKEQVPVKDAKVLAHLEESQKRNTTQACVISFAPRVSSSCRLPLVEDVKELAHVRLSQYRCRVPSIFCLLNPQGVQEVQVLLIQPPAKEVKVLAHMGRRTASR